MSVYFLNILKFKVHYETMLPKCHKGLEKEYLNHYVAFNIYYISTDIAYTSNSFLSRFLCF